MRVKFVFIFILNFCLMSISYAGEYLQDEFSTVNKFVSLCGSSKEIEEEKCFGYLVGFLDGMHVASLSTSININSQKLTTTSSLTIIRIINKGIERSPETGDFPTSIALAAALNNLGILQIKFKGSKD